MSGPLFFHKRVWESTIFQQRKRWRGGDAEAFGGGEVDICSAVSGEVLLAVPITPEEAVVPCLRKAVAASSLIPYFPIYVLLDSDVLVDDVHSWDDCHCADKVSVVKKPRSLEWTQDVFQAIDSGAEEGLRQCLRAPKFVFVTLNQPTNQKSMDKSQQA